MRRPRAETGRSVVAAVAPSPTTAGSARSLHLHDRIGRLAPGMEADLTILDLASTAAIAQRRARAETIWEAVFPTIMMGDDRAIADVWIAGSKRPRPAVSSA